MRLWDTRCFLSGFPHCLALRLFRGLESYKISGDEITSETLVPLPNLRVFLTSHSYPSVVVRAPAKLNLFLELLRKRDDGYHDIDTVMVPIDRYDTLVVRSSPQPGIRIETRWWPNRDHWVSCLGAASADGLLDIPNDERNLIYRAIAATAALSGSSLGFDVEVRKRIPAGAGMGGASSDAAAAIRAVAALMDLPPHDPRLHEVAAAIGSDVPFFLGASEFLGAHKAPRANEAKSRLSRDESGDNVPTNWLDSDRMAESSPVAAMRALGRGEILNRVELPVALRFLIAFPAVSLSTASVYRASKIPECPDSSEPLIRAMKHGEIEKMGQEMRNRLAEPALKISGLVEDLLEQMWQTGLPRCQLTGSGSACYSLLDDSSDIVALEKQLSTTLNAHRIPAVIFSARSISIPQRIRTRT